MRIEKEEQKDNYRCVEILHIEHDFPFEGFEIINAMRILIAVNYLNYSVCRF